MAQWTAGRFLSDTIPVRVGSIPHPGVCYLPWAIARTSNCSAYLRCRVGNTMLIWPSMGCRRSPIPLRYRRTWWSRAGETVQLAQSSWCTPCSPGPSLSGRCISRYLDTSSFFSFWPSRPRPAADTDTFFSFCPSQPPMLEYEKFNFLFKKTYEIANSAKSQTGPQRELNPLPLALKASVLTTGRCDPMAVV